MMLMIVELVNYGLCLHKCVGNGTAWKAKEMPVLYGNTDLQPRYFRSVLGLLDFLQKYLCTPSKTAKAAPAIVQIPVDYIFILKATYVCAFYKT